MKNPKIFEIWKKTIRNPKFDGKTLKQMSEYWICGKHLEKTYLSLSFNTKRTYTLFVHNAIPTLHLPRCADMTYGNLGNGAKENNMEVSLSLVLNSEASVSTIEENYRSLSISGPLNEYLIVDGNKKENIKKISRKKGERGAVLKEH